MKVQKPASVHTKKETFWKKPEEDSRKGRLHEVKTDRGEFRFKDNRSGD